MRAQNCEIPVCNSFGGRGPATGAYLKPDVTKAERVSGGRGRSHWAERLPSFMFHHQDRRAVLANSPFVSPLLQSDQYREEFLAFGSETIAFPSAPLLKGDLFDNPDFDEPLEPRVQDIPGNPQPFLELIETRRSEEAFADDEQAPPLADFIERPRYRTVHFAEGFSLHSRNIDTTVA